MGPVLFSESVPHIFLHRYMRSLRHSPNSEKMNPDLIVNNYGKKATLMGKVKRNGVQAGYRNYRLNAKTVDTKASEVRREYLTKAGKLDAEHAPEVCSPGPFKESRNTFHGGGVTPFCFGAFGERWKEVDIYVKRCAKLAACRQEGLEFSPLGGSVGHLSAYSLALGVLVLSGNAMLKLKLVQFVRPTRAEAESAAA